MTSKKLRPSRLKKQAAAYIERGYVRAGRSWVKVGSKADRAEKARVAYIRSKRGFSI